MCLMKIVSLLNLFFFIIILCLCSVVTVGFGSGGVTVYESSGQFIMCVVKDQVVVQEVTVTIDPQNETAISNLGKVTKS